MTTGLADALAALPDQADAPPGPQCSIGALLSLLTETDPDAAALLRATLDGPVKAVPIAETLTKEGHPIAVHTIRRHRRRGTPVGCRCPR